MAFLPACRPADDAGHVEKVFGETGLGPGQLSYPRALAVSPVDGCVFVVDKAARIQRFSPDGEYETGWRMPEYANGKPTGLHVDRQNRLWVADTHYSRVLVFDRNGQELLRFGETGREPGRFLLPTDVELDADGNVYVSEYGDGTNDRIQKFTPDLKFLKSFADPTSGEGSTSRPNALTFDEAGNLWVADVCRHRICRYDRDGRFLGAFGEMGEGPGQLMNPYGLALEAGDTLLVADRSNNRIARFTRDGKYLASWGSPGREVGRLGNPWAVAVSNDGRIYCLDSWNNRVQVIRW